MIFKETIDEVKNRLDIVDVIGDFITLKKAGQNYKALSPFTNEKTPSFFVVPSKGIFKDFSSGKGGDAFTFLMEHEGMTYAEAIRFLANKYGVEIKENVQEPDDPSDREGLYILMNFAKDYYKELLLKNEEGRGVGLSYFRERGFNDRTIQKFELGYALNEWEAFSKHALNKSYSQELLEKTGLVVKKEDGSSYDRFRGRVIFPVHNLSGKVVAFGARMLGKDKNQPKYINSPETEIYHKSQVLYGLYQGKNAIRQHDVCYLVEGYTDVISLHQSEVENVVSSSGTALTEDQIKLIRRFTENVTVLFDGDAAGIKAALRGIDLLLKGGLNVRVVLFPDGEDPDSYSRKLGTSAFREFLDKNTTDFISFKLRLLSQDGLRDPIKKVEALHDVVQSISLIPDVLKRAVFVEECSRMLNVEYSLLNTEVNKLLIKERIGAKSTSGRFETTPLSFGDIHKISQVIMYDPLQQLNLLEKEFIKLLVEFGGQQLEDGTGASEYLLYETSDIEFNNPIHTKIIDAYKSESSDHLIDASSFLRTVDPSVSEYLSSILVQKYQEPSSTWHTHRFVDGREYILDEALYKVVSWMKLRFLQVMIAENLKKIKNAKTEDEGKNLIDIQQSLENAKVELAAIFGTVILAPSKPY